MASETAHQLVARPPQIDEAIHLAERYADEFKRTKIPRQLGSLRIASASRDEEG